MASCSRLCHAGQLLNFGCRIESGSWRRACSKCMESFSDGLEIPAGRCRLLTRSCGSFGGGRNFFVLWSTPMGPIDGVRALKLKGSDHMLLVFVEESMAVQCEEGLDAGTLIRVEGEIVTLRMCAGSKSFCHIDNFASEGSRTCGAHLSWPAAADGAKGGGRKRGRTAPPPVKAAPVAAADEGMVSLDALLCCIGGDGQLAMPENQFAVVTSEQELLAAAPSAASLRSEDRTLSPLSTSSEGLALSLPLLAAAAPSPLGLGPSSLVGGPDFSLAAFDGPDGSLTESNDAKSDDSQGESGDSDALAHSADPMHSAGADSDTLSSSHDTDEAAGGCSGAFAQLDVAGRLMAHGETLKAGGSSQWTVVSDARLKDVVATFDLGAGVLAQLRPKVFRYKAGLAGFDPHKLYVGLIAQEVPDSLAPYCRVRTRVRLRPADEEDTEIFMLDHSCLQFVCINALQEASEQLARASEQLAASARAARVEAAAAHGRFRRLSRLSAATSALRDSFKAGSALAIVSAVVAFYSSSVARYGMAPVNIASVACVALCLTVYGVCDAPKGRSVWDQSSTTGIVVCIASLVVPAIGAYRVFTADLATEGDGIFQQLALRAAPNSHFPLSVLVMGVFLGSLKLSARTRVAVSIVPLLLLQAIWVISYFRMRSLPSMAASIGPLCSHLAWRSISSMAIGTFGCRAGVRLLRPCSAIVDVLEETEVDGKIYQALATAEGLQASA